MNLKAGRDPYLEQGAQMGCTLVDGHNGIPLHQRMLGSLVKFERRGSSGERREIADDSVTRHAVLLHGPQLAWHQIGRMLGYTARAEIDWTVSTTTSRRSTGALTRCTRTPAAATCCTLGAITEEHFDQTLDRNVKGVVFTGAEGAAAARLGDQRRIRHPGRLDHEQQRNRELQHLQRNQSGGPQSHRRFPSGASAARKPTSGCSPSSETRMSRASSEEWRSAG